jgi:hypothetical protein
MMEQLQKIQEEAEHTRTHRNTEKEVPEPRRPRRGGPSRGRPRRPRD